MNPKAQEEQKNSTDNSTPKLNIPKQYNLIASLVEIDNIGKAWHLNSDVLTSVLSGFQYAIKDKKEYILAELYPQNSYLIINEKDSKFSVVSSIFLTYSNDRIIARRKSTGNVPVWELLDKEYIKACKDAQMALLFEDRLFAECYDKEVFVVKNTSLKKHTVVTKEFKIATLKSQPAISKIPILKYASLNAVSIFKKYFRIEPSALNFIHIRGLEKYKMANTNFNEIFAIGLILDSIEADGFTLDKEVSIVTMFEEQKHALIDFYAHRLGHETNRPKIGLPYEMCEKNFNVSIFSLVISSKNEKYSTIETYEHNIRKIIDNSKDGALFVGDFKILSDIAGFAKELTGLAKTLKTVSTLSAWSDPLAYGEKVIELWREPIKKMNPDKTSNKTQKALRDKLFKNIEFEFERKNTQGMTSIYKEYLRILGIKS
ncbi:MAG: hypothetical protein QG567_582 [Campylobacterota bacterium]|nr:hypothetical protein [Campylobacterota bacterium]